MDTYVSNPAGILVQIGQFLKREGFSLLVDAIIVSEVSRKISSGGKVKIGERLALSCFYQGEPEFMDQHWTNLSVVEPARAATTNFRDIKTHTPKHRKRILAQPRYWNCKFRKSVRTCCLLLARGQEESWSRRFGRSSTAYSRR